MADPFETGDWQEADAAFERIGREGKAAIEANDVQLARRRIGEAVALAKAHFRIGDPRLAAAIACQAWLIREEDPARAARLFQDAMAQWRQADAWLLGQPAPRRLARSSSFHLRLESKHTGAYQERRRAEMKSLLAIGQAVTEGLSEGRMMPSSAARSLTGKDGSSAFDSFRKVAQAVDLVTSCRGD